MKSFVDQMPEEMQKEIYEELHQKFSSNGRIRQAGKATNEEKLNACAKIMNILGKHSLPDQRAIRRFVGETIDKGAKRWGKGC